MLSHVISTRLLVLLGAALFLALGCLIQDARGNEPLPVPIDRILAGPETPDEKLSALMTAIPRVMGTDRAFLWVRDPEKNRVKFSHSHSNDPTKRNFISSGWGPDVHPRSIEKPLLRRAFLSPHAIFIDDIYDQPAEMLNADFQALVFENRALVHAPLYVDGTLYGILQTDVFDGPRDWSDEDIALMRQIQTHLAPLTVAYLANQ